MEEKAKQGEEEGEEACEAPEKPAFPGRREPGKEAEKAQPEKRGDTETKVTSGTATQHHKSVNRQGNNQDDPGFGSKEADPLAKAATGEGEGKDPAPEAGATRKKSLPLAGKEAMASHCCLILSS